MITILKTLFFFVVKSALEGDRSTLSSLAKLTVGCMSFYYFFSIFRAFGVHFGGPGAPLASFWPLGAPRAIQDLIFSLFFRLLDRLGSPRGAKRSPKERKGDQNGAQSAP